MNTLFRFTLLIFCCTFFSFGYSQIQLDSTQTAHLLQIFSLTDNRDGNTYEAIQIGNLTWLRENLRLETAGSHCPNYNRKKKDCNEGNYYPYQELDSLCPINWHVATVKEWENYFSWMRKYRDLENTKFERDTFYPMIGWISLMDTTNQIRLFNEDNPLNLQATGWVQGRRRRNTGTTTIWAIEEKYDDRRFHLHIGPRGFVKHAHKHHIDDKRRRTRKFSVRCVMNKN